MFIVESLTGSPTIEAHNRSSIIAYDDRAGVGMITHFDIFSGEWTVHDQNDLLARVFRLQKVNQGVKNTAGFDPTRSADRFATRPDQARNVRQGGTRASQGAHDAHQVGRSPHKLRRTQIKCKATPELDLYGNPHDGS
jgi:hypothetical protein